jgi:WD40 repeat protein
MGEEIAVFRGHNAQVRSLVFLPDGKRLLSGSYDGTLRLWDATTGETLQLFRGHSDFVMSVDVSPDGRLAVSGSFDETVRIWELESGKCLRVLRGERPYEGMNVAGAKGLTSAQIASLKELGAIESF